MTTTVTPNDIAVTMAEIDLLDIGSGPESAARKYFPNAKITRLDADDELKPDVVHDITKPFPTELQGSFDVVYASHVLEHIARLDILPTIDNMASGLRNMGELWVMVPSLEWAASEVLKDQPSPVVQAVIFGSQNNEFQYHKTGYTLYALRGLLQRAGLIIRQAYQGVFFIEMESAVYAARQNIVVGMRYDQE